MQRVHQDGLPGHSVRLSVIQQRNGPAGTIDMSFLETLQQFA
jgi:replicative DNA helicase